MKPAGIAGPAGGDDGDRRGACRVGRADRGDLRGRVHGEGRCGRAVEAHRSGTGEIRPGQCHRRTAGDRTLKRHDAGEGWSRGIGIGGRRLIPYWCLGWW